MTPKQIRTGIAASALAISALSLALVKTRKPDTSPSAADAANARPVRERATFQEPPLPIRQTIEQHAYALQQFHQSTDARLQKLTEKLHLTGAQQNQIRKEMDAFPADVRERTDRERFFVHTKGEDTRHWLALLSGGEFDAEMAALLSPEQRIAYDELLANEHQTQMEAEAALKLGRLIDLTKDMTPEQQDAAMRVFASSEDDEGADEGLKSVLNEDQLRLYSERAAIEQAAIQPTVPERAPQQATAQPR